MATATSITPLAHSTQPTASEPSWPTALLFTAMAGGMGWGIRGQYGHETGAMMAGALVALVLTLLFAPGAMSLTVARAVALATVAIGFGGSETYGQTVGLTHDPDLVGNWSALRWGLLGLSIKGAIWIGPFGAFLGMGLSGRRYRPVEHLLLMLGLVGLMLLGIALINAPYDPARRLLPRLYFSATWDWKPLVPDPKPRLERWGGLLLAWLGLTAYVGLVRRDQLAWKLSLWAFVGGAIGFPLGQCLQAFHAWNRPWFATGPLARIDPLLNWWNFMETTFGATFGAVLATGFWRNRHLVQLDEAPAPEVSIPTTVEWLLVAAHVALLVTWNFVRWPAFGTIADLAIPMGLIPIVAIAGGRLWPYLLTLPITALPIAAKTFRSVVAEEHALDPTLGSLVYVGLPLAAMTALALQLAGGDRPWDRAAKFLRPALLASALLDFGLNSAFFRFAWPWSAWTARTPNMVVYLVCLFGLVGLSLGRVRRSPER